MGDDGDEQPLVPHLDAHVRVLHADDHPLHLRGTGSVYLCLPTSICKGVAEKPHVHRAVSHNQFLKLL
uniref:Uncharacterized protein n=1 Tax=Meleagris gallopavo TaxID=9103 RepID=A0A803YG63_MELGA